MHLSPYLCIFLSLCSFYFYSFVGTKDQDIYNSFWQLFCVGVKRGRLLLGENVNYSYFNLKVPRTVLAPNRNEISEKFRICLVHIKKSPFVFM
jgi:hypothetical protein